MKYLFRMCAVIVLGMLLCAGLLAPAHAEVTVTEEWVARYDGPENWMDNAYAIATDDVGNVYVTGYSYGVGTDYDYATIAYDASGNQLWAARYNGPGNSQDIGRAIAIGNEGNVYVTGSSRGSSTYDDYATVAYDSMGTQLWVARYNGPANNNDYAQAIATDTEGNVYVTGYSGTGDYTNSDYATVAYDSSGNELWSARYDGPVSGGDRANAIAIGSTGNIYVTGLSRNETDFDYATVAYGPSGSQLWVARYDGPSNFSDVANDIAVDDTGNVYVTGTSYGIGTGSDYATVAYDSSGNELWVARYNGPGDLRDEANAIATDSAGNVYVTGTSQSSWNSYHLDYATLAYDSQGNQLWVARYNGPTAFEQDIAYAIVVGSSGNVHVTGQSPGSGTGNDFATVAYDFSGNELWVVRYDGPESSGDAAYAMALDSAGNVYVTGVSYNIGNISDYATIKYSQQGLNSPPVACAGADQVVECTGSAGASVTLDGTCSSDPDNDTLTYTWTGPFGTATGAVAAVTLPVGTHTVTLTVDDNRGGTDTDEIVITVEDTTPPDVTATLSGYVLQSGLYLDDVLFEMTATDTCTGVSNVRYILDGSQTIVSGGYASATVSIGGVHEFVYDAMDIAGNASVAGSMSFMLFEANSDGLVALVDHFASQGLIDPKAESSLKGMAANGAYDAFISYAERQSGKKIDTDTALILIGAADYIKGN